MQLCQITPHRSARATRPARPASQVMTAAASPYAVSLAIRIPCRRPAGRRRNNHSRASESSAAGRLRHSAHLPLTSRSKLRLLCCAAEAAGRLRPSLPEAAARAHVSDRDCASHAHARLDPQSVKGGGGAHGPGAVRRRKTGGTACGRARPCAPKLAHNHPHPYPGDLLFCVRARECVRVRGGGRASERESVRAGACA